jgi:hypothetical protein
VTGYYLIDRYPFVTEAPPSKEIQKSLKEAEKLVTLISTDMKNK